MTKNFLIIPKQRWKGIEVCASELKRKVKYLPEGAYEILEECLLTLPNNHGGYDTMNAKKLLSKKHGTWLLISNRG